MKHVFRKGNDPQAPVILLLHGTGGNEQDLIPLAEMVAPGASVLGVRGNVLENGMPRFFRRLAEGVFDIEDLVFRTKELSEFVDTAAEQYDFDRNNVVALGYSNGANIAASMLFHDAKALRGAILHHAMVPLRGLDLPELNGVPVFLSSGENDPIVPTLESRELQALLEGAGAQVEAYWERNGHQLTRTEMPPQANGLESILMYKITR